MGWERGGWVLCPQAPSLCHLLTKGTAPVGSSVSRGSTNFSIPSPLQVLGHINLTAPSSRYCSSPGGFPAYCPLRIIANSPFIMPTLNYANLGVNLFSTGTLSYTNE